MVGREWAIPSPGDYLQVEVAGERVLIVRSRVGCARGVLQRLSSPRVASGDGRAPDDGDGAAPTGHFKGGIRCPYHAWTYGLDGQLRNAPFLTESDGLPPRTAEPVPGGRRDVGGLRVRQSHAVRADARAIAKPVAARRRHRSGLRTIRWGLRVGTRITYDIDANWKTIVENYNECYHCGPVHPELCELVPAFKQGGGRELDWDNGVPRREG